MNRKTWGRCYMNRSAFVFTALIAMFAINFAILGYAVGMSMPGEHLPADDAGATAEPEPAPVPVAVAVQDPPEEPAWGPDPAVAQLEGEAGQARRLELGRMLFFDNRLSGDATMSCATCHSPDKGWTDGGIPMRFVP